MAVSCTLCRGACGVALVACLIASLGFVPQPAEDTGFLQTLRAMDERHYSELGPSKLHRYVLEGRPVIIDLNNQMGRDEMRQQSNSSIRQNLLDLCGSQEIMLISSATSRAFEIFASWTLSHVIFAVLFGDRLADWFARMSQPKTINRFVQDMRRTEQWGSPKKPFHLWLLSKMSNLVAMYITPFKTVYYSTPYLSDLPINDVCPDLLRSTASGYHSVRAQIDSYANDSWIRKRIPQFDVEPIKVDRALKLYWGGPFSISYPMHTDYADGDLLMYMVNGCKEVVVLDHPHNQDLDYVWPLNIQGTTVFGIDVFDHPAPPPGSVTGYRATVKPGQLLYLPADLRHVIRNRCIDSVAISHRPWRTTGVHEIIRRQQASATEN